MVESENKEIEYTRKNAKFLLKKGDYLTAKTILESLWNESSQGDVYLLYDYGKALRKTNGNAVFIDICRKQNDNEKISGNIFIKSTLCWCLYDEYIKNYSAEEKDGFPDFIKRAEFIINNCEQKEAAEHYKTPYVFTIRKVVKILNGRPSKNYKQIIRWLTFLNSEKLSEDVFNFQDDKGKDRELASPKEFYYQNMAKALEKTGKYEECIQICEKAFEQISNFHYRNHIWIKARLYFCKCNINKDVGTAIAEYKNLAYKENFWFMYHKLSQICFKYNKINEALLYSSKAFSCRFEYEKMVNLLFDTALLWQSLGNDCNAKPFYQACAYYRNRQGWYISEELEYAISTFEIDIEEKPNISILQKISKDFVTKIEGGNERIEGIVYEVFSHGGSGFIKVKQRGLKVYFNMKDVFGRKGLVEGDSVEFEIVDQEDGRKRAVRIVKRG